MQVYRPHSYLVQIGERFFGYNKLDEALSVYDSLYKAVRIVDENGEQKNTNLNLYAHTNAGFIELRQAYFGTSD